MNEQEFSNEFINTLQSKLPDVKLISRNELELELDLGNDFQIKQFLDNAYSEYKSEPQEIKEILEKYVNAICNFMGEQNNTIQLEDIVPIIKNNAFIEANMELNPDFKEQILFENINDELILFFGVNSETSLKFLLKSEFEEFNISKEKIKEISIENLKNIDTIERQGDNGYYSLLFEGNFEASLILLDIWNKDNFDVKGEIVIAIPARDVLLITGSEDKANIKKMEKTTTDICTNGDHIISEKLFIYKNNELQIFK